MEQKIYCGPNIAKFGLFRYQVFIGEDYAFNVKDAIKAIPEVEHLFCSVANLETMRRACETAGTAENVYYREIEKKIKELR